MTDYPTPIILPLFVSSLGPQSATSLAMAGVTGVATGVYTWPASKRIIYIPVGIPWPYPVVRVYWGNGSTATGNMDFGIYSTDGTRIYHTGSVAMSGASQLQFVSVATPFILSPGSYYFTLDYEGTTENRAWGQSTLATNEGRLGGLRQQSEAFPLPETATFAAWASTGIPLCGVTKTASGF